MKTSNKFLYLYLAIAFGACYGVAIVFIFFADLVVPLVGELTLMHPIAIIALYSPTIAGFITYYAMGGWKGVKDLLMRIVPRKEHLFWIPILVATAVVFAASMHYGSKLFGIPVPDNSYTVWGMVGKTFLNLFQETGLIGGVFGWIGFLLPYLQEKLKNNVTSGLITGLLFGIWVLPGYIISSFGTQTAYIYYVIQLMIFVVFQSYVFNATKGNIFFYLLTFWLVATGSQIDLYYFNPQVQIMQITFFLLAAIVLHLIYKKKSEVSLQTLPRYVQA